MKMLRRLVVLISFACLVISVCIGQVIVASFLVDAPGRYKSLGGPFVRRGFVLFEDSTWAFGSYQAIENLVPGEGSLTGDAAFSPNIKGKIYKLDNDEYALYSSNDSNAYLTVGNYYGESYKIKADNLYVLGIHGLYKREAIDDEYQYMDEYDFLLTDIPDNKHKAFGHSRKVLINADNLGGLFEALGVFKFKSNKKPAQEVKSLKSFISDLRLRKGDTGYVKGQEFWLIYKEGKPSKSVPLIPHGRGKINLCGFIDSIFVFEGDDLHFGDYRIFLNDNGYIYQDNPKKKPIEWDGRIR